MTATWAAGVFRPLDHLVAGDARCIHVCGRHYCFALCGCPTLLPGETEIGLRPPCRECRARWPGKEVSSP